MSLGAPGLPTSSFNPASTFFPSSSSSSSGSSHFGGPPASLPSPSSVNPQTHGSSPFGGFGGHSSSSSSSSSSPLGTTFGNHRVHHVPNSHHTLHSSIPTTSVYTTDSSYPTSYSRHHYSSSPVETCCFSIGLLFLIAAIVGLCLIGALV